MKLICPQQNDAFTVSDTTNGNGALTYPIGLITTDETVLAGGWDVPNYSYYLCSGSWYLASSPHDFLGSNAFVSSIGAIGYASSTTSLSDSNDGVRPVLNLSSDVLQNGNGSMNNPYHPCLLYTSPSPRDDRTSRMPSSA